MVFPVRNSYSLLQVLPPYTEEYAVPHTTSPLSWREWRKGRLSWERVMFPSLVAAMSVKDSFITAMMVGSSWGSPTGSGSSSWDTSSLTSSTWAAE